LEAALLDNIEKTSGRKTAENRGGGLYRRDIDLTTMTYSGD
jgi:hypothetical protein